MSAGFSRTHILVVAALLGIVTAGLVYLYMFGPMRTGSKTTEVVVAATYIAPDTVISTDMIRVILLPTRDLAKEAATRLSQVADMVTVTAFQQGEQMVAGNLVDKATAFGLPGIIPPGTRAMTITVDNAGAVSGLLQPGDHVDVVASFSLASDSMARMILQDVVLLAVDSRMSAVQKPQKDSKETKEPTMTSVTIAVTPQESEALVAAQYKGKLMLGLRGLDDNSRIVTMGASTSGILGLPPPSQPGYRPGMPTTVVAQKPATVVSRSRSSPRRPAPPHRPARPASRNSTA